MISSFVSDKLIIKKIMSRTNVRRTFGIIGLLVPMACVIGN